MADEKLYTQDEVNYWISQALKSTKSRYSVLTRGLESDMSGLESEIRNLKDQNKSKDNTIKSLSVAIVNLSKKGN